jgi:hypothetical protein
MTTSQFSSSSTDTGFGDDSTTGTDSASTKEQAQEKAQQVAGTAADEGRNLAATAKDEAAAVAGEAQTQVRNLMSEATTEIQDQTRTQQRRLAGTVRSFAEDLQNMAADQSGMASDVARQVADRAQSLAGHLEGREPSDLLGDVRDFARRRPGTFLLGALAAGVVAGRLTRAAQAAKSESDTSTVTSPVTTAGNASGTSTFPAQPGFAADVTSPAEPLSGGAHAAPSGSGFGTTGDVGGTASADPLEGTGAEDAPWSDSGNRP